MVTKMNKSILKAIGLSKKLGIIITIQNIKRLMIFLDQVTKYLDKLEKEGHIGTWNSGKKFTLLKKINSKIVSII